MYGLGIDTGGTYTDAVIYDFTGRGVLSSAKALTTREDLRTGILQSLGGLDRSLFGEVGLVSLSTTLATNACVEDKGGRAKLIFIGVDKRVTEQNGQKYGLPPVEEIYFLDYNGLFDGKIITPPDWSRFEGEISEFLMDADSVGIVDIFASKNGAELEKRARELVAERFNKPIICGHELFDDLNSLKRGASTLLNARLIPIIGEFVSAIRHSLAQVGVSAPIVLVRSDGSLMNEDFSALRPVETLLCGPCASVIGGMNLSGEKDCIVVDMGGTTTDISIVRDGIPVRARDGVNIGKWRTYVKGIFTDTFGLGGDSAIRCTSGAVELDSTRIIPISVLAQRYPHIMDTLRPLGDSDIIHTRPLNEFYVLQKELPPSSRNSPQDIALCEALKSGPLSYRQAAETVGSDVYRINFTRLEREGILLRAGLTPTDIMCCAGDYKIQGGEAAELSAKYIARCAGYPSTKALCETIYDKIKKKIYTNIARILWQQEHPESADGISPELAALIDQSWDNPTSLYSVKIKTPLAFIGIGAPIHIFLPEVADRLGTRCIIPAHAGVANAIGAVMGNITVSCDIIVKPVYSPDGFLVFGRTETRFEESLSPAIEFALAEAQAYAREEAIRRGAQGELTITTSLQDNSAPLRGSEVFHLNTVVNATAVGSVAFGV